MVAKKAKTTTEKGLGWRHEQAVEYLRMVHRDGSPCDWCGREMWLDDSKNYDFDKSDPEKRGNGRLQGDHSKKSRKESLKAGEKVLPPDRLLHAECNRIRGAGMNDEFAFVNQRVLDVSDSLMDWPFNE